MDASNTSDQDRVLSRIRKMLALANDAAASDGERDNAMRMVHATLAKHNLTMAEAEAADHQKVEAREDGITTSRDQPWTRHVAHSIGKLFFCRYFYTKTARRGTVAHHFVGRLSNVTTAKEMTDFVIRSIMSEANKRWKLQANPGPWWTSFCKGAGDRVAIRCAEIQRSAEVASSSEKSTGTSLVLASFYKTEMDANKAFLEAQGLTLVVKKAREKRVTAGYTEGSTFGSSISLNRQLGNKPADQRRLK